MSFGRLQKAPFFSALLICPRLDWHLGSDNKQAAAVIIRLKTAGKAVK